MTTTPTYDQIIAELDAGQRVAIARKIFDLLKKYPDGLTRRDLVYNIFGAIASRDINNDTNDRKIRETIASMRARLIPIVSTSGKSGYRFDDSEQARREMIAELESRRARLDEQIRAAYQVLRIPAPAVYSEPQQATQGRLL